LVSLITLIDTIKNMLLIEILGSTELLMLFIVFFFGILILVHKGNLPLIAVIFVPLILLFSSSSFITTTITPIFGETSIILLAMIVSVLITLLYFKLFK